MPIHNEKGRGGRKFSVTERDEVIEFVAKHDRFGASQRTIAARAYEHFGVHLSQPTIHIYLKKIRKRYQESALASRGEVIQEHLQRLRSIRDEAYDKYQKSQKVLKKIVSEKGSTGKGYIDKVTKTKEQRIASAEWLQIIMECDKQERKLLGLDEPVRTESKNLNLNGTINPQEVWDELLQPPQQNRAKILVERVLDQQRKELQEEYQRDRRRIEKDGNGKGKTTTGNDGEEPGPKKKGQGKDSTHKSGGKGFRK